MPELPWQRRPRANELLPALRNPHRAFHAVVTGEPQRTFYGNQFDNTFPAFVRFRIPLWVDRHAPPVPPVSRDGRALRPRRADDGFATERMEGTAQ
ncbi:hypothetical protein SAMN05216533_1455 [Streptomyces sp. Ag109_O5-10]|nr:hypothetical protein SAMN05216533_1455 [Streptomyces sp. Ag109_O5-10]